jgi:hypothetical protein
LEAVHYEATLILFLSTLSPTADMGTELLEMQYKARAITHTA